MPVQSAFTLVIITGAFSLAGGLIGGLNYLQEGKKKRSTAQTHFGHHLEQRDKALKIVFKDTGKMS